MYAWYAIGFGGGGGGELPMSIYGVSLTSYPPLLAGLINYINTKAKMSSSKKIDL